MFYNKNLMEIFEEHKDEMIFNDIKEKLDFPSTKCQKSEIQSKNVKETNEKIFLSPSGKETPFLAILNSQFYLIQIIGKGSSGKVYLSYSIQDQKEEKSFFAIKIINNKETNDNYINECEVDFLEKMNHKNILKVYGHGLGLLKTKSLLHYYGLFRPWLFIISS